ncbi:hypothetical protein [Luteolibacter sp. AS25]|uniref:hypothetical protein n=1 Tax=Luteolibacter sp. AS25 TaxID=3135776 RepID=UPI00398AE497
MKQPPSLYIHGHGAVSSAGTTPAELYQACLGETEIPTVNLEREVAGKSVSYPHRPVDSKALRTAMPKHPRLRRSSSVTKFSVTAAHQAIGAERLERMQNHELKIGIVLTFLNGCVNYSNRFFSEVLSDPSLASPILFPETVFNAPASHIASYLECDGPVYTLLGDSATWFSAFHVADDWISSGLVDGCLILCAEEIDWLTLEGLSLYSRKLIATEGAAAVYLEKNPSPIAVENFQGPYSYTDTGERRKAIQTSFDTQSDKSADLLIDGLTGIPKLDKDESNTTKQWTGPTLSPATTLGEGMGIRCGFQTIAAIESLKTHNSAQIQASGTNQHAFSLKLTKSQNL